MSTTSVSSAVVGRRPASLPLGRVVLVLGAALALLLGVTPWTRALLPAAQAATCPCTMFGETTPATASANDPSAVELGVKFTASESGSVTGIRFYKGTANTGTHTGSLWTRDGTRLATVTFGTETATGWQTASFPTPVAITAGTTYVASYHAPNGGYAVTYEGLSSTVTSAPLTALADGADGGNGVYRYGTGGGFPANTYRASNYFVDVVFTAAGPDTTAPTVTSTSPANGATGVPVTAAATATFSEDVKPESVVLGLATSAGTAVAGTTTYDGATRTATFRPSAALATSTGYTATLSAAADTAGNALAAPITWSFTTAATADGCPCSIWPSSTTPAVTSQADDSAVELGVKFRSDVDGFISGIRFYKGSGNTGTHTGSLWTSTGTQLATATFTSESASGWQSVTFGAPVAVTANTTYVASYYAPVGRYAIDSGYFATEKVTAPLRALANGTVGGNGVYKYGASGFPSSSWNASNYWVDVLFTSSGADTTAPTVVSRTPAPGETGVATTAVATATWSEAVQPSTVTFTLTGPNGANVPGTVTYDEGTRTSTFTPSAALASSTTYSASVGGAKDLTGNVMAASVTWTFTTGAPPAPIGQGPGGPVLVVTSATNAFSGYTTEILRTEGLNAFATADVSQLSGTLLDGYDTAVLGSTALTSAQVEMLTSWVERGGNLVALKPDKQLATLLGLTPVTGTGATRSEAYLKVDTAAAPGKGITPETMQYHGVADVYTTAGATAVAALYSNATTATTNPAVTLRSVGTNGGQAAAFAYDLPRSIVLTRQGNPAWAGQERDGANPVRSDDLYFGGSSLDFVNLGKAAVPQADEQQRLLTNVIQTMNADRKPLPRFWYFPRGAKALVVNTGDDHGNNGTAGRFDQLSANSPSGCSVDDWACLRAASYIYPGTPLSNTNAGSYDKAGFEVGIHPSSGCANFTATSLASDYSSQLSEWRKKYASLASPTTNRLHCIVWSDWNSQAKVELSNGMRLDTNYYYWPGSWVADRPGFMTGSGMPMRFANTDGSMVDVYQAATQLTDESDQTYPFTPDTLLDRALGAEGYYGAFVANMHTDQATIYQNDQLISSARSRGVPMVSSRQLLQWLDGRNASTFTGLTWSGNQLSFGVTVGAGARGLTAMLPIDAPGGSLSALTRDGAPVAYRTETIKGITYAVFDAAGGNHVATYAGAKTVSMTTASMTRLSTSSLRSATTSDVTGRSSRLAPGQVSSGTGTQVAPADDTTAPVIDAVQVKPLPDGTAQVLWRTDETATSTVEFGIGHSFERRLSADTRVVNHAVVVTGLEAGRTYRARVTSRDAAGNTATAGPFRFVSATPGAVDTSAAALRMGSGDAYLGEGGDGELLLPPAVGAEFSTPVLPPGLERNVDQSRGRADVTAGEVRLDGATAGTVALYSPASSLEFSATFRRGGPQYAGLAAGKAPSSSSAVFGVENDRLVAKVTGATGATRELPAWNRCVNATGEGSCVYRIDWGTSSVAFWVGDGERPLEKVAEIPAALKAKMKPLAWDQLVDAAALDVQYLRLSGYRPTSSFFSRVLDAQAMVEWDRAYVDAETPPSTKVELLVRTGSMSRPDASWTPWQKVALDGGRIGKPGRYAQYQLVLTTGAQDRTPRVRSVGLTHNGEPVEHIGETGGPE